MHTVEARSHVTDELFPTERRRLHKKFAGVMETAYQLSRKTVSFQANRNEPIYRWFKYREGFSSELVKYFLENYSTPKGTGKPGKILDPFAGAGTALFAAQELGWQSYGIELLPVGTFVMETRQAIEDIDIKKLSSAIKDLWSAVEKIKKYDIHINHITITRDAFPDDTEILLNKYLTYCSTIRDKKLKAVLRFAAFSVLEEISYTRKDGQYLRWDYRSKRELPGKPYNIGNILGFEQAISKKLSEIIHDLSHDGSDFLFDFPKPNGHPKFPINITEGSCLEELPKLEGGFFDFIITSPPYCNRYDYTRTYALELVFLGNDSDGVRNLRQSMLSCTVENKQKVDQLKQFYSSIGRAKTFDKVMEVYSNSAAMTEVNSVLDELNKLDKLNNNNVPRMVKNYFLEMCFVINEMARVTKTGGYCVMVNDNVRYGGEGIPVDLILSEFAENLGFEIKKIFVLPKGKGNSSQQMGSYGRTEVRKCVYVWQKE